MDGMPNRFKTHPDDIVTMAIHGRDVKMLQRAIDKGADINSQTSTESAVKFTTSLIYAIRNDWLEGVRILLENGADIDLQDNMTGTTPLMEAVLVNNMLIVEEIKNAYLEKIKEEK